MSVSVLLVTHPGIGSAILAAAKRILGHLPLPVEAMDVAFDADVQAMANAAGRKMMELERGDGVLLLTDLFGASPANTSGAANSMGIRVRRVSGLNLPMLLRVLNYPEQDLEQMVLTASGGGRNGVVIDQG